MITRNSKHIKFWYLFTHLEDRWQNLGQGLTQRECFTPSPESIFNFFFGIDMSVGLNESIIFTFNISQHFNFKNLPITSQFYLRLEGDEANLTHIISLIIFFPLNSGFSNKWSIIFHYEYHKKWLENGIDKQAVSCKQHRQSWMNKSLLRIWFTPND